MNDDFNYLRAYKKYNIRTESFLEIVLLFFFNSYLKLKKKDHLNETKLAKVVAKIFHSQEQCQNSTVLPKDSGKDERFSRSNK